MTAATALGRDCIGTWLVGSAVILALIFVAMARSRSGGIMRSFSATMNQDGLNFQAALVSFSSNALAKMGPA